MAQIFNPNPGNTLDTVANALKEQANAANKDVNDAIKALQGTDNADNPALLAGCNTRSTSGRSSTTSTRR